MAKVKKKSAIPVYAVAVTWAVYASSNPMYELKNLIIAAVLSYVVYKIAGKIWKPKWVEVEDKPKEPAAPPPRTEPEEEPEEPENTELKAFIKEGQRAVGEMNRLNDDISDPEISRRISRLTELTDKIFAHVAENPQKLTRVRKFVNYYVPTTIKLLNAYDRMGAQGIEGENIGGTMRKIEDMLDTIVKAFEKQLDNLFSAEAMDISADITVLEDMIEREGLSGNSKIGG